MATPAEVKERILPRLKQKIVAEFEWADLVAAVQAATTQQKADVVAGIRGRSKDAVGLAVLRIAKLKIDTDADAEADAIVADNAIDFTEIDRVL